MSPAVIQQLNMVCLQVDRQAHAQIAVVTVTTLDDTPIEDYAVNLYQAWGLGAKSGQNQDRGVLILIATQDRKRWISTGYGLEGILPDGKVGQIGRAMVPMLRNNDFDGAMTLAVGQVSQIIAADAGVKLTPLPGYAALPQEQQVMHISLGQIIFFGIIFLVIIFFLSRIGGGGLLWFLLGMFMGGGGRGGGGFGGGGDSGGGGFGGFGGGSTGGGGAGGSW
jgi:uncharacterized protein